MILVGVAVALLGPSSPASATDVRTMQVNVMGQAGSFQQTDSGRIIAATYIASRASSEMPLAISLNEVCPTQVLHIMVEVGASYSHNYGVAFGRPWEQRFNNCAPPGDSAVFYGNAILMRFTQIDRPDPVYYPGSSGAFRNATCLTTAVFLNTFHSCSTHFSSPPTVDEKDVFGFVVGVNPARYRFGMGDLNAGRASLPSLYSTGWREADRCPLPGRCSNKQVTADGGSRIDYVYGIRSNTLAGTNSCSDPVGVDNACITPVGFSDHHVVRGFYVLR